MIHLFDPLAIFGQTRPKFIHQWWEWFWHWHLPAFTSSFTKFMVFSSCCRHQRTKKASPRSWALQPQNPQPHGIWEMLPKSAGILLWWCFEARVLKFSIVLTLKREYPTRSPLAQICPFKFYLSILPSVSPKNIPSSISAMSPLPASPLPQRPGPPTCST